MVKYHTDIRGEKGFCLDGFYGISPIVDYLMQNSVYTYRNMKSKYVVESI